MTPTPAPIRSLPAKQAASWALMSWLVALLAPVSAPLVLVTLVLALPAQASADEPGATAPAAPAASAAEPASGETTTAPGAVTTTPAPATPGPTEAGAETTPEAGSGANTGGPQVEAQHVQSVTPEGSGTAGKGGAHAKTQGKGVGTTGGAGGPQKTGGTSGSEVRAKHRAPSPSDLTPSLPLALGGSIAGASDFFVESFQIPPFLLPIYQAAGTAYGIPWQVLAAINEVETDYGRDLSVSSAGAEGWMQFLPSTWTQYGVDANGDGFKDPYNPADAIFAAARYLRAAGGDTNVRAAVYSYNHSQAYVDTVMLRAQLLGGTPPELLGAVTGLTEARFPVHAASHYSDGFGTIPAHGSSPARALPGTTIYSQVGAPVIAAQDGEVVQIGDTPSLGRFVSLRDAYGNTYVYAQLGSVAALYPVLVPHDHTAVSARIAQPGGAAGEPAPSGPATAGAQPRSPVSEGAAVSGLALGAAAGLEPAPSAPAPAPAPTQPAAPQATAPATVRVFRSGPDDVYLHPLRAGVQVIAGTVLGHVGGEAGDTAAGQSTSPATGGPHIFFQIKPAGVQAPLIDPKPILDGWVALENTSIFRAKGENPFLATSPTVGQVLLESKGQLEQQVARDSSIHMRACERQDVQTGRVDKRVLAALEFLSVSGLKPTVAGIACADGAPASEGNASTSSDEVVKITAVNGVPIAGHQGQGSIADTTIRKLLMLQGVNRPRRIISLMSIPGTTNTLAKPSARDWIYVSFSSLGGSGAHAAGVLGSALTPNEWIKLIARLGEIPDPTVASGPSTAAIPDKPGTPVPGSGSTGSGGPAAPGASGAGTGSSAENEGDSNGHG
jgi:murein DD-endopeptidase MepM/ murein hydrolase activator NlpD